MKTAILGIRGIPNNYVGFEQCAEYLALGLVKRASKLSCVIHITIGENKIF